MTDFLISVRSGVDKISDDVGYSPSRLTAIAQNGEPVNSFNGLLARIKNGEVVSNSIFSISVRRDEGGLSLGTVLTSEIKM